EATLVFTAPTTPGTYHLRFFANGGYTRLATSGPIEVPPGPTLRVNDVSVTEGHAGTVEATFTVTLSPANPTQVVSVNYATANGTATAGSDYVATSGTLIFDPSVTSRTISVAINGDSAFEQNDTFFVNLSQPVNAVIGDAQGAGTIINDDQAGTPSVTAGPATVAPGGTITATVTNGPGNLRDWVGLYGTAAPDTPSLAWLYLDGTKNVPAQALTEATLVFTAPTTPGTYQLRFFANDGYTRLATSGTITVAP
ncbi:MAG: Calx-beta domain-containing protein, partial [Steroidobacteraceae bacterium]